MDFVVQAVCSNGCAAVLLITLLLNYGRKHNAKEDSFGLFIWMIVSNLLQCVVETATVVIDGRLFSGAVSLATVLNAFLFANTSFFSWMWALYADAKIRYDKPTKTVWTYLQSLPALFIVGCSVHNLFTPVFFRITQENIYQRMGIYLVAYGVTYFYLIMGTVKIYIHRKRAEKFTFLPVFTFLLPVCLASVVQYLVPGISLMWAGSAVGLASAYMSLLDESASTDKLSGLFSRQYLNRFLNTLPTRVRDTRHLVGIMLDVDDFKAINDTYGHLMGDNAIAGAGYILRKAIPGRRMIFRYAGDEFVVILPLEDLTELTPIIERIHMETAHYLEKHEQPYRLHFSVGYTAYVPGENPNEFLARMDTEMYKNKKANRCLPKE